MVPNKYPALAPDSAAQIDNDDFYRARNGVGVHEVIIESPAHVTSMAGFDERQLIEYCALTRSACAIGKRIGAGNTRWSIKTKASAPARLSNMRTLS